MYFHNHLFDMFNLDTFFYESYDGFDSDQLKPLYIW